jgi:hypothetical protein
MNCCKSYRIALAMISFVVRSVLGLFMGINNGNRGKSFCPPWVVDILWEGVMDLCEGRTQHYETRLMFYILISLVGHQVPKVENLLCFLKRPKIVLFEVFQTPHGFLVLRIVFLSSPTKPVFLLHPSNSAFYETILTEKKMR